MSEPGFFDGETSAGGIQGVVVAIVTNNEDPKDMGRVKLRYPWRDADDESYWARIATPMSGDQYGTYFLPEVDDEVLVAFENGDIHKPYVVGSLWNGKQKPPQKNEGKNKTREIRSRSEHRLTFEDDSKNDEGSITIQTSGGHEIIVDDSKNKETILIRDKDKKNKILLDGNSDTIDIEASKDLNLSAQNITIEGDKSVKVKGGTKVDISSKNTATLSGKSKVDVKSNGLMGINATGPLTIKGALIRLN
ncbi:phage baseplate assembly protein V [Halomicrobium katesii]|uniref:phage baseplate assembly protein V n=1 Tax=Halomicrobium katesii TaxID=437163 RepID=UPI000364FA39|nr:phage baseplate assembly protein V [Halomicrobium katesii]